VTDRIRLDIETRSRLDVKKVNVYRYCKDPDFSILMCAWSMDGEPATIETNQKASVDRLMDHVVSGDILVAHNAPFERVCFSAALGMPVGTYLDPEQWHDTMAVARERGLPGGLDKIAKAIGATPKDGAGSALIRYWCSPISTGHRKGQFRQPEEDPEKWQQFIDYCCQDVDTLVEIDDIMGYGHVTDLERQVYMADQRINDRGIKVDTALCAAAEIAALKNATWQRARVTELSGIENPGSVPQVKKWLTDEGIKIKNLKAATVEALLADEHPDLKLQTPIQREVLELRQELALAAPAKFSSALATVGSDARLRGSLVYFKAHTGRWAGSGTQPHNLPRLAFTDTYVYDPVLDKKVPIVGSGVLDESMAIHGVLQGDDFRTEDLKRLVRPMFLGPLTIFDYKAIEAVVIAGLSGETWVLEAIASGRDIYVETAKRMGNLTRAQGKIAVLALGFQGGIGSLKAMGGATIIENGVEREMTDDEYWTLVTQWRKANPKTVKLWSILQNAMADGGPAGPMLRVTFSRGTKPNCRTAHLWLPSGRAITYRNLGWEKYTVVDELTEKRIHKEGWRFDSGQGFRAATYGGRLTENATQGTARDLLAAALVRLEKAGYRVVFHVHDEIAVEGPHTPEQVEEIQRLIFEKPAWAAHLPVLGEGAQLDRYRKF
jgi:DNA polymerase